MIGSPTNNLADHGHLLVRRAVNRSDWIADALLELAAADQQCWTLAEWDALLAELDSSDMTISEFIDFYGEN